MTNNENILKMDETVSQSEYEYKTDTERIIIPDGSLNVHNLKSIGKSSESKVFHKTENRICNAWSAVADADQ